ncbi:MAG: hypothetical protein WA323_27465, partial [Candidatus Nitrosopolaris sp.]
MTVIEVVMNSNTTMTFGILVIALASLFAVGPILGNQQALAANAGGSFGGGGGSFGGGGGSFGGGGHVGGGGFAGH